MLNILKIKQKASNEYWLYNHTIDINKNKKTEQIIKNNYKNIIYYPSSTKEWFNSIYSYNKSYTKSLITFDTIINNLFQSYFNMFESNIKIFKRRRANKIRYSGNKLFVSRAELKHTNNKLSIILYVFNKQKLNIEKFTRRALIFTKPKKQFLSKKTLKEIYINRVTNLLKNKIFYFKE